LQDGRRRNGNQLIFGEKMLMHYLIEEHVKNARQAASAWLGVFYAKRVGVYSPFWGIPFFPDFH
jgi:hypothetical protein